MIERGIGSFMNLEMELGTTFRLSSKLNEIPRIVYRTFGDTNILEQFKIWGIENYQRHDNKYSESNYLEWKDLILDSDLLCSPSKLAFTINVIDAIVEWYDNTDEDVCIFCSDDLNFSNTQYWPFDWKFLMQQLPYNWDCIQLTAYSMEYISMHMHPWIKTLGHKCFMITRYFAKRLKHYHYLEGKYKLHYTTPDRSISINDYGTLNEFFYDLGITYTFPIFSHTQDTLKSNDNEEKMYQTCSEGIDYWWKQKSNLFSNYEFFNYRKDDDEWKMELQFELRADNTLEVYMDKMRAIRIWI